MKANSPAKIGILGFIEDNPRMITVLAGVMAFLDAYFNGVFNFLVLLLIAIVLLYFRDKNYLKYIPHICFSITASAFFFAPSALHDFVGDANHVIDSGMVLGVDMLSTYSLIECLVGISLVVFMTHILQKTRSWSLVVELGCVVSLVSIILVKLLVPDIDLMIKDLLGVIFGKLLEVGSEANVPEQTEVIDLLTPVFLGISMMAFTLRSLFCLWLVVLFGRSRGDKYLTELSVSKVMVALLIMVGIGLLMKVEIVRTLLPVIYIPFLLAGLSVMHYYQRLYRVNVLFVIPVYILIVMQVKVVLFMFLGVAVVDGLYSLRIKVSKNN